MKNLVLISVVLVLAGCQRTPSEVAAKVMTDFGLREAPEGYVSGSDMVYQNLDKVGQMELKRMNLEGKHGEIKVHKNGLHVAFYKECKVYEAYYPTDARAVTKTNERERGYVGYVEYAYRIYQSARRKSRAEAQAADADVPTETTGRETYRYNFSTSGNWDGQEGEKTKR